MSQDLPPIDPPPPESAPVKPGMARARLPFESDEAIRRRGAGQTAAWLYATGAIALVALAGYMAFVEGVAPTDPRVWAPAAVGVWFVVRAVMTASRR
jgi:hypothetical protein